MKKVKILKRDRINHILLSIFKYPLTIVEAPMGFGKTTAVKDFLKHKKSYSIWISFLKPGRNTSCFWDKFVEGILKFDEILGKKLKSLGFPVDAPQTEKILSLLNMVSFQQKTVLVLDDFHLCTNNDLYDFLLQMALEQMDNFYIVLITRSTNNMNFTELLLKGMCNVISQQQLKFNEMEINNYCSMMSDIITEDNYKKINKYTDGWVSLIYITIMALEKGIPVGMSSFIDELIEKAMFNTYESQIQNFLLKLSVMNSFTADQALFVTQEKKAPELLKELHSKNAFVNFDDAKKCYKIHNVLLDFLLTRQRFSEEEHRNLYTRLGKWYLEKGEFLTGYTYLNIAGAHDKILTHLSNPSNIRNELVDFEGSFEMFNGLPQNVLNQYPLAYLQHIFLSIVRGTEDIIKDCSMKLDRLMKVYERIENIEEDFRSRILAETLIIKKFTTFNHIDLSGEINVEIIKLLGGRQSYILRRDNESTFGSPHLLYIYFRDLGTLKNIMQIIGDKYVIYSSFANGNGTGSDYLAKAEYALEIADFYNAELSSFKAIYKARTKDQTSVIICATFNLIRLYIIQGKLDEALVMLKQLEHDLSEINNPIHNTALELCKGYIYACLGQSEKIPWWLQSGEMTEADMLFQGITFSYIIYGKAVMLSGKYLELEVLSESFHEHFSIYHNQLGFIHNGIFDAVAKYQLYGINEGVAALQVALAKGQADDIVMPFAENAPYIIEILKQIVTTSSNNEYYKKVLSCCEQYNKSLLNSQMHKIKLSHRETEVLTLTAEGLTRNEIAACLVVSPGTVKTHLQNIYQKLEVSGKISAIKIAKKHGLIK
ncbi:MAG: LuxR C-terminal-related transcriptional regulator [Velocimicrobium sp.]